MTKPQLIIVDDEPDMAEFVSDLADDLGFDVKIATSAKELQSIYNSTTPVGIVMDIVMPEMDGNDLLQWLIQKKRNTPIIIISGYDRQYLETAEMLGQARGATIIGTLAKPIRADDMESLLRKFLIQ